MIQICIVAYDVTSGKLKGDKLEQMSLTPSDKSKSKVGTSPSMKWFAISSYETSVYAVIAGALIRYELQQ